MMNVVLKSSLLPTRFYKRFAQRTTVLSSIHKYQRFHINSSYCQRPLTARNSMMRPSMKVRTTLEEVHPNSATCDFPCGFNVEHILKAMGNLDESQITGDAAILLVLCQALVRAHYRMLRDESQYRWLSRDIHDAHLQLLFTDTTAHLRNTVQFVRFLTITDGCISSQPEYSEHLLLCLHYMGLETSNSLMLKLYAISKQRVLTSSWSALCCFVTVAAIVAPADYALYRQVLDRLMVTCVNDIDSASELLPYFKTIAHCPSLFSPNFCHKLVHQLKDVFQNDNKMTSSELLVAWTAAVGNLSRVADSKLMAVLDECMIDIRQKINDFRPDMTSTEICQMLRNLNGHLPVSLFEKNEALLDGAPCHDIAMILAYEDKNFARSKTALLEIPSAFERNILDMTSWIRMDSRKLLWGRPDEAYRRIACERPRDFIKSRVNCASFPYETIEAYNDKINSHLLDISAVSVRNCDVSRVFAGMLVNCNRQERSALLPHFTDVISNAALDDLMVLKWALNSVLVNRLDSVGNVLTFVKRLWLAVETQLKHRLVTNSMSALPLDTLITVANESMLPFTSCQHPNIINLCMQEIERCGTAELSISKFMQIFRLCQSVHYYSPTLMDGMVDVVLTSRLTEHSPRVIQQAASFCANFGFQPRDFQPLVDACVRTVQHGLATKQWSLCVGTLKQLALLGVYPRDELTQLYTAESVNGILKSAIEQDAHTYEGNDFMHLSRIVRLVRPDIRIDAPLSDPTLTDLSPTFERVALDVQAHVIQQHSSLFDVQGRRVQLGTAIDIELTPVTTKSTSRSQQLSREQRSREQRSRERKPTAIIVLSKRSGCINRNHVITGYPRMRKTMLELLGYRVVVIYQQDYFTQHRGVTLQLLDTILTNPLYTDQSCIIAYKQIYKLQ